MANTESNRVNRVNRINRTVSRFDRPEDHGQLAAYCMDLSASADYQGVWQNLKLQYYTSAPEVASITTQKRKKKEEVEYSVSDALVQSNKSLEDFGDAS